MGLTVHQTRVLTYLADKHGCKEHPAPVTALLTAFISRPVSLRRPNLREADWLLAALLFSGRGRRTYPPDRASRRQRTRLTPYRSPCDSMHLAHLENLGVFALLDPRPHRPKPGRKGKPTYMIRPGKKPHGPGMIGLQRNMAPTLLTKMIFSLQTHRRFGPLNSIGSG